MNHYADCLNVFTPCVLPTWVTRGLTFMGHGLTFMDNSWVNIVNKLITEDETKEV